MKVTLGDHQLSSLLLSQRQVIREQGDKRTNSISGWRYGQESRHSKQGHSGKKPMEETNTYWAEE